MPDAIQLRVRQLPDGEFIPALQPMLKDRLLEIELAQQRLPIGSLVEVEFGGMLYLGELQRRYDTTSVIFLEHSIDHEQLASIQSTWS
jgi:hypothetical protein